MFYLHPSKINFLFISPNNRRRGRTGQAAVWAPPTWAPWFWAPSYGPPDLGSGSEFEKNLFAPPRFGPVQIFQKPLFGMSRYGPRPVFMRRRQPKYVATVNLSMWQPESVVLISLRMYSTGADRRGAGNLDGSSSPPGPNFHPIFFVYCMWQPSI